MPPYQYLLALLAFLSSVDACHPRFEKELRYLDLYLGIKPDNGGDIPSKDSAQFASYVSNAKSLDCDFESECLWRNAPSDGLLDTSDFWYFKKTDSKLLPVQIQPGRADIAEGSHLVLAGNTSNVAESAVLVSAPIACQRKPGNLTFHYWLYNNARVEVIVVRATHRRRHLQSLFRPKINCHILRPGNDICNVHIPSVSEPFRLAIRAFNLKDNVVGSMVMLKNLTYRAETCGESPFPSIFGSMPLVPRPSLPIETISDLDCDRPRSKCRYWLKAGTQVEVCSVDIDSIALSCAYLSEEDSPGPIEIDVDAYDQPFRFTLEMIAFDETSIGLVAISDIRLKGLLCSEEPPPIVTTIDPPTIVSLFGLQQGPGANTPYPTDLNCDFSKDYCSQWVNDDGLVAYGVAPRNSKKFPVPSGIKGNVATFVLEGMKTSILRSREVSCAHNASVTVTYMRSEHGLVRLCALGQCVDGSKVSGEMTIMATSPKPFEFSIEAASHKNAVVVISEISVSGNVCPLKTMQELVCDKLMCNFNGNLCNYESPVDKPDDVPLSTGPAGATATLDVGQHRAILRSAKFDLPAPLILNITITQSTFGSRVLLCPDITSESESCQELLGPRVETSEKKTVMFPLDEGAHRFAVVLYHDKAEQFGAAQFIVHSIDIRSSQNEILC
ncbi:hypothetical protein ANCCAN_09124 [Ancylostoma caninum]|uniref:MAM domain-containing protein n=1 Tax=Ancylostoma caninum TaxID=29170 RepID=A0A368GMS2_ANCCA|nr:hypothetical protein ANCCAN_09124 [Ancylostoma caninum]